MASQDNQYNVVFMAKYDAAGAQAMEKDMEAIRTNSAQMSQEMRTGAEAAGKSTNELRGEVSEMGHGMHSAHLLTASFSRLLSGDLEGALMGVTKGFKGLKIALAENPIGLLVTGLAVAVGLWAKFHEGAEASAEGAKKAGEESENAAPKIDEVAEAVKRSKEAFEQGKGIVEGYAKAIEEASSAAEHARKRFDELDDAKAATAIAKIDSAEAAGQISAPDAMRQRGEIRDRTERAKLQREQEGNTLDLFNNRLGREEAVKAAEEEDKKARDAYEKKKEAEDNIRSAEFEREKRIQEENETALGKVTFPDRAGSKGIQEYIDAQKEEAKKAGEEASKHDAEMGGARSSIGKFDDKIKDLETHGEVLREKQKQINERYVKDEVEAENKAGEARKKAAEEAQKGEHKGDVNLPRDAAAAKRAQQEAEIRKQAAAAAGDAGGLQGKSPEVTRDLEAAAKAFANVVQGGNMDAIAGAISNLSTVIKGVTGHLKKQSEGPLKKLENDIKQLQNEVGRLKQDNG